MKKKYFIFYTIFVLCVGAALGSFFRNDAAEASSQTISTKLISAKLLDDKTIGVYAVHPTGNNTKLNVKSRDAYSYSINIEVISTK